MSKYLLNLRSSIYHIIVVEVAWFCHYKVWKRGIFLPPNSRLALTPSEYIISYVGQKVIQSEENKNGYRIEESFEVKKNSAENVKDKFGYYLWEFDYY